MVDSFPVIHELVRERRFPHFFRSRYPGKTICLVTGFEISAEIAVLGLNSMSPGVDAGI